jgi:hypothetical protein
MHNHLEALEYLRSIAEWIEGEKTQRRMREALAMIADRLDDKTERQEPDMSKIALVIENQAAQIVDLKTQLTTAQAAAPDAADVAELAKFNADGTPVTPAPAVSSST